MLLIFSLTVIPNHVAEIARLRAALLHMNEAIERNPNLRGRADAAAIALDAMPENAAAQAHAAAAAEALTEAEAKSSQPRPSSRQ